MKQSNLAAFRAGYNFGETAELFASSYEVKPTHFDPGDYTNISGNTALAWGLIAASQLSKLPLFLGSYPITPASDILHELSKHKNFGVRTMQAEDEIAGISAAIGAAFGGHLAVTTTSGPGVDLKAEAKMHLAMTRASIANTMSNPLVNDPRIHHVRYTDFVADPVGTACGVYEHFGLPFSDAVRGAMQQADADSRSGERRPSHRYTLEQFGLTDAMVEERFGYLR